MNRVACWKTTLLGGVLLILGGVVISGESEGGQGMSMKIESSAFAHNGDIPQRFTCDGQDLSPPLTWSECQRTRKPGAERSGCAGSKGTEDDMVHWVLYNTFASASGLPEGFVSGVAAGTAEESTIEANRLWRPLNRAHRYFHKLYALDTVLPGLNKPTKAQLESHAGTYPGASRTHRSLSARQVM